MNDEKKMDVNEIIENKTNSMTSSDIMEALEDIDYDKVKSLRIEAVQKLKEYRPVSIGQASRISGVSPADISVLLVYLGGK